MLSNAEIGSADSSDGIVKQGLLVTCLLNGSETEFFLGSHEIFEGTKFEQQIEDGDLDVYSPDSPIGQAILGTKVNEEVGYTAPNGKTITVKVVKLSNFEFEFSKSLGFNPAFFRDSMTSSRCALPLVSTLRSSSTSEISRPFP